MSKKISGFFTVAFSSIWFLFSPSCVFAQAPKEWSGKCVSNTDVATIQGFECLFYNALQVIVFIAGISFLFMFISGGFKYLFSSGDAKKAAAASSTLTMAIIGLVGVIGSWLILRLIENFTGVNVTDFIIPG